MPRIAIGYISIILYLLMVGGMAFLARKDEDRSIFSRKAIHLLIIGVFWLAYYNFGSLYLHYLVVSASMLVGFLLSQALSSLKKPRFDKGIFFYCLSYTAMAMVVYLDPRFFLPFVLSIHCLSISDALSAIGVMSRKHYLPDSSLIGSSLCFLSSFLASFILLSAFSSLEGYTSVLLALLLAISTTIFEIAPNKFDNLTIPLGCFFVASMVLIFPERGLYPMLACMGVIFVLVFTKGMTYWGALASGMIGFIYYLGGGLFAFLFIMAPTVAVVMLALIKKILNKKAGDDVVARGSRKDLIQVLANGLAPITLFIIYLFVHQPFLILAALVATTALYSDSFSSDVGVLSRKDPYDFLRRQRVKPGVSGGISLLGSLAGITVSAIGGLVLYLHYRLALPYLFLLMLLPLVGPIVDTVLGSLLQAQYRCGICGKITEKRIHCNQETTLVKGLKWLNNDAVNLVSLFVCAGVATLVLGVMA